MALRSCRRICDRPNGLLRVGWFFEFLQWMLNGLPWLYLLISLFSIVFIWFLQALLAALPPHQRRQTAELLSMQLRSALIQHGEAWTNFYSTTLEKCRYCKYLLLWFAIFVYSDKKQSALREAWDIHQRSIVGSAKFLDVRWVGGNSSAEINRFAKAVHLGLRLRILNPN